MMNVPADATETTRTCRYPPLSSQGGDPRVFVKGDRVCVRNINGRNFEGIYHARSGSVGSPLLHRIRFPGSSDNTPRFIDWKDVGKMSSPEEKALVQLSEEGRLPLNTVSGIMSYVGRRGGKRKTHRKNHRKSKRRTRR